MAYAMTEGQRLVFPRVWLRISTWQKESTLGTRGFSRVVPPKTRAAKKLRGRALFSSAEDRRHERRSHYEGSKPETAPEKPLVPRVEGTMTAQIPCAVSVDWLHKNLGDKRVHLALVDTTWFSDKDAIEGFSKQHIVHASYMDIFSGVEISPLYPRNIPDEATFQMNARGSALNSNDHVVVYENTGKFGFFLGARAWWMFKLFGHQNVSVLDGGLERWIANGFDTTNMMVKKKEGDFKAKLNPEWIVKFEDMVENLTSRKVQVCDSRVPEKFHLSPDDPKSGHYPGAINIPFTSLFNLETRTLKSVVELKKVYSDAGIDLNKPVICMCFSGMSSCSLLLAAHLCGCSDTALYLGGFTEWKARAEPSQIE